MTDNKKIAADVLEAVGGKENVTFVAHCMTRLRFNLKDIDAPDIKEVKKIGGVLGAQISGGQFQVIVGAYDPRPIVCWPVQDRSGGAGTYDGGRAVRHKRPLCSDEHGL